MSKSSHPIVIVAAALATLGMGIGARAESPTTQPSPEIKALILKEVHVPFNFTDLPLP